MKTEILLPQAGMAMTDGEVVAWRKAIGDPVDLGDVLVEVEGAKTVVEVEAPAAGVLSAIMADVGTVVPVQGVLGLIDAAVATVGGQSPVSGTMNAGKAESTAPVVTAAAGVDTPSASRVIITPAARRVARELNVDLSRVVGTGPGGRMVEADIRAAVVAPATPPVVTRTEEAPPPARPAPAGDAAPAVPDVSPVGAPLSLVAASVIEFPWAGEDQSAADRFIRALCLTIRELPVLRRALADVDGQIAISYHDAASPSPHTLIADALSLTVAGISAARDRAQPASGAIRLGISWFGNTQVDQAAVPLSGSQLLSVGVGRSREVLRRAGDSMRWTRVVTVETVVDNAMVDVTVLAELIAGIARHLDRLDEHLARELP
jgi:pyruvate/2-oxoglutarate dehydrogenase complex dihydrolipoamide acyltransferase (E2) component